MKNDTALKIIEDIKNSNITINQVMDKSVRQWVDQNNEDKLRIYFYKTSHKDIIVDIGSYDGTWIAKFLKYHTGCKAVCYEPTKRFFNLLEKNTLDYSSRIKNHNFGLSNSNMTTTIDDQLGLAAKVNTGKEIIKLKDIFKELSKYKKIKLLKVNIEGGEYQCIPRIIETGLICNIENLQIQFHSNGSKEKTLNSYQEIFKSLSKTHSIDYFFPFIWENWRRNKNI